jgi:hypothetical protein
MSRRRKREEAVDDGFVAALFSGGAAETPSTAAAQEEKEKVKRARPGQVRNSPVAKLEAEAKVDNDAAPLPTSPATTTTTTTSPPLHPIFLAFAKVFFKYPERLDLNYQLYMHLARLKSWNGLTVIDLPEFGSYVFRGFDPLTPSVRIRLLLVVASHVHKRVLE